MGFKQLDPEQWRRLFSRAAIIGLPNSWKTSSLRTWPRPIHILSYPGENGAAAIPQEDGIHAYVWEDDPATAKSPTAIVNEVERTTTEILAGKYGPIKTFAGDGFHKLYSVMYDAAFNELTDALPHIDSDKLGGRAYAEAHKKAFRYFKRVNSSSVPYAVMTMWSGRDKDDPENKNSQSHIWPDLPGTLATKVMGEFGVVLYAEPGLEIAPGKFKPGTWQVRKGGKVWGAGMKLPPAVAARVPTIVEQDWGKLERVVFGDPTPAPLAPPPPPAPAQQPAKPASPVMAKA